MHPVLNKARVVQSHVSQSIWHQAQHHNPATALQKLDIDKVQSKPTICLQKHSVRHAASSRLRQGGWHHHELNCHHVQDPSRSGSVQQSTIDSIIFQRYVSLQDSNLDHCQSVDLFLHSHEFWHPSSRYPHLARYLPDIAFFADRQRLEEYSFDQFLQIRML